MSLIAILLALIAERLLGRIRWWGEPIFFGLVFRTLRWLFPWRFIWSSPLIIPVLLAPPLLVVSWARDQIDDPVVALLASALVLLLCMGPRDLTNDVRRLLAAREAGDADTVAALTRALQRGPEPDPSHRSLVGALFIQSHERLFGVLLWFTALSFFGLGPVGAVGYRLARRLPRLLHPDGDTLAARLADTLHGALAFIPVRITAVLFGLAGSLDDAVSAWRRLRHSPDHGWRSRTWAVIAEAGVGSLETDGPDGAPALPPTLEETLKETLRLQTRALLILLAAFAFFTTGAWVG